MTTKSKKTSITKSTRKLEDLRTKKMGRSFMGSLEAERRCSKEIENFEILSKKYLITSSI